MWQLKTMLKISLLLFLLFFALCYSLKANPSDQSMTELSSKLLPIITQLETVNLKQSAELQNSKKELKLWQGHFTTLEAQHKILIAQSTEQQTLIANQKTLLTGLETSLKEQNKAHQDEISRLKWTTVKWTIYGIGIGIGTGLLLMGLLK